MSITPKQAYEAAKVLWPGITYLQKHHLGWYAMEFHADGTGICDHLRSGVTIEWGDTDQYPPPEPEWVDAVFPQDVGKQGRFSDNREEWYEGMIRGQNEGGYWMVRNTTWKFCQVRKVKT
jgi:hypothetical protein